jgi:hypothetical protein
LVDKYKIFNVKLDFILWNILRIFFIARIHYIRVLRGKVLAHGCVGASVGRKIPMAWSVFFLSSKSTTLIAFFSRKFLSNSFVPNALVAFLSYGMASFFL